MGPSDGKVEIHVLLVCLVYLSASLLIPRIKLMNFLSLSCFEVFDRYQQVYYAFFSSSDLIHVQILVVSTRHVPTLLSVEYVRLQRMTNFLRDSAFEVISFLY